MGSIRAHCRARRPGTWHMATSQAVGTPNSRLSSTTPSTNPEVLRR